MNKVLVLGAGFVSRPVVRYLLDQPGFKVTVAEQVVSKAEAVVAGHPNGVALPLDVTDTAKLTQLVSEHDLAISLLPAPLHPVVAEMCIQQRKHMATASYVSPKMRELDRAARDAGVICLNELGVDPGIDHMSAMRVIHDVARRGGKVVSFKSCCGGLPAPDANDNPWGYKFSWSPRAVCTAGKNAARFRIDGQQVDIPGPELFTHVEEVEIEPIGQLEAYPNRDSLGYIELYGLEGIETMFRGTFRYPGWCRCLKKVVDLNMLDETPVSFAAGTTFAQWTAGLLGSENTDDLRAKAAERIGLDAGDDVLERFEWLGLFAADELLIVERETTNLDLLAARMGEKMSYRPGERDMIVMVHRFIAKFPDGKEEQISSELIDYGQPDGDSSMARTVGLPVAVGAKMVLTGEIKDAGVHIPVTPELYNPILDELETMGIKCQERRI